MNYKGFVDVQVNGFMGIDFSMPGLSIDDVIKVTLSLAKLGTIGYCPTVVTSSMDVYRDNLKTIAEAAKLPEISGHILGIHLEGPFISPTPGASGAHQAKYIIPPSIDDFKFMQECAEGTVKILTVAPEVAGAEELIKYAVGQGVIVSLGHHLSDNESLKRAVAAGAISATHLGNGIPNELPRHNNPIWWQLACDDLWGTFITDGCHLPPVYIKVALRAKTLDRFIVISDAAPLAGMPMGTYESFGKEVIIEPSGRIFIPETQGLGGSHSTMIECMNYLAALDLLSEEELWQVGLLNPLKLLGISYESIKDVPVNAVKYIDKQFKN